MRRVFTTVVALFLIVGTFTLAHADNPNPHCGDRSIPARPLHPIKIVVEANCRVFGDIQVGPVGTSRYTIFPDNDPNSGMIVDCIKKCKVLFKYGGGITGQLIESIGLDMMNIKQCASGCERVDLRFFPR